VGVKLCLWIQRRSAVVRRRSRSPDLHGFRVGVRVGVGDGGIGRMRVGALGVVRVCAGVGLTMDGCGSVGSGGSTRVRVRVGNGVAVGVAVGVSVAVGWGVAVGGGSVGAGELTTKTRTRPPKLFPARSYIARRIVYAPSGNRCVSQVPSTPS